MPTFEKETLVSEKEVVAGSDLEGLDLTNDFGIKCFKDKEHGALSLSIPGFLFEKIHPGEKIFKMIAESSSLGAKAEGDNYIVAFPKDISKQEIQAIIDEIRNRYLNRSKN